MKTMKLTNAEVMAARDAIAVIDTGTQSKDKDGKMQHEPFKLGGLVRLKLGRLHKRMSEQCEIIEKTRVDLQKQYHVGSKEAKAEDMQTSMQEWNKVRSESAEYDGLPTFTQAELQIETGANNEFPATVLSGLLPFIREDAVEKPAK